MKILLNILLIVIIPNAFGQNMISNPSFEDTLSCPTNSGQIQYSSNWFNSRGTPDLYHSCNNGPYVSVPNNLWGFEPAHNGVSYAGLYTYLWGNLNNREYIGTTLSSPLNIGQQYYVSFWVKSVFTLPNGDNSATNGIGAYFSNVIYDSINFLTPNNFAHVISSTIIEDSLDWVQISGSFIADSNYQYVYFGNFYDDLNTSIISYSSNFNIRSYILLDEICISKNEFSNCNIVNLKEISKAKLKTPYQIIDSMGRITQDKSNAFLIYLYSDGTTKKVYNLE